MKHSTQTSEDIMQNMSHEARLFAVALITVIATNYAFGESLGDGINRCASFAFAYLAARAVYLRAIEIKFSTYILANLAGLLLSCGGGIIRTTFVLDLPTWLPGSLGNIGDMCAVALGLALAVYIGGGGTAGKVNATLPRSLKMIDIASGITFCALGVSLAFNLLTPDAVFSYETLCITAAGYLTACGGGLTVSMLNAFNGYADGVGNLRLYGAAMATFTLIFTASAFVTGGVSLFLNIGIMALGTASYLKIETLLFPKKH